MLPRSVAALLLFALPALLPAAVDIVRVWPAYRDADSFRRISEYLGGREGSGREIVLRSQAADRSGYYFLTRVKSDLALEDTNLVVEVVLPGNPAVRTFTFPAAIASGAKVYQLGLTGTDWPAKNIRPAAWRVTARGADGAILAELASFLWSGPAGAK